MTKKKKNTVKAELTFGQVILCPNITNIKQSRLSNGAVYRLLDMTFVRILNPKMPPDMPPKREIFVLKYDNDVQQFMFENKELLCEAMTKRIKEHPEYSEKFGKILL
jgi:hypothetical protein